MAFVDRREELGALKERASSERAEFIIIYGRRRIGKSELINELLKSARGIKLLAREESEELQLKRFSEGLSKLFNDVMLQKNPLTNWDAFFTYIDGHAKKKIVVALDEFPYLVAENKALPSILQDHWDNRLKNGKACIILCGSSISMMEDILGHKNPLYGRRTAQLLIRPFSFKQAREYLKTEFEEAIKAYGIFGGTPAYLLEYDLKKTLKQNLQEKVLRSDSFLCSDVEFILKEELREPRYYFSILSSIARGNTKISTIINDTGLEKSIVGKYISILSELMLVKREVPALENPLKSRKGIYVLNDNFFRFWFRFIYQNKEHIEKNEPAPVLEDIWKNLSEHLGPLFESICKEAVDELNARKVFVFSKIGRWWHKDKEIDIVAVNDDTKEIMFCECKWQDKVDARKIIEGLKAKAQFVEWNNGKRKEKYCVFAKSFKEEIDDMDIALFDLKRLEKVFEGKRA